MANQIDFNSFLSNIEPSKTTVSSISSIQTNLREYLRKHDTYKEVYSGSFLSGSYAKHTSIRPVLGDNKRDVDIVVITSHTNDDDSKDVLNELLEVLAESDKYKNAHLQHHSIGIEMSGICIDVVPVIEDEDDDELYYIADSETGDWTATDPKGHIAWSTETNKDNNNEYKPLVKIFKWWRRVNCPSDVKYPKGITLEKIIADNLGDSSLSTEGFLLGTMQNIVSAYKDDYVSNEVNPVVCDPSEKVGDNNLLSGYSVDDFSSFVTKLEDHIDLLDKEGTGNAVWRKVLGDQFPNSSDVSKSFAVASVQNCISAPHRKRAYWPEQRGGAVFISTTVVSPQGDKFEYQNNGESLAKHCSLHFKAITGIKKPYSVYWQIVNTGYEAQRAGGLRGGFEQSNDGNNGRIETTLYAGTHLVQCFVIRKGTCVAKSKDFFINIV